MKVEVPTGKRSWPLLSITAFSAIAAGLAYGQQNNPAIGAILLTIGSISFGAWLVTEIVWLFNHIQDDRKDHHHGQSSTGQGSNNAVQENRE